MVRALFSRMQIGHHSHIVQFMSFIYAPYTLFSAFCIFCCCAFRSRSLDSLHISSIYVGNNYSCNSKYTNIDLLFQFWLLAQYCLHCHVTYIYIRVSIPYAKQSRTFRIHSHRKRTQTPRVVVVYMTSRG